MYLIQAIANPTQTSLDIFTLEGFYLFASRLVGTLLALVISAYLVKTYFPNKPNPVPPPVRVFTLCWSLIFAATAFWFLVDNKLSQPPWLRGVYITSVIGLVWGLFWSLKQAKSCFNKKCNCKTSASMEEMLNKTEALVQKELHDRDNS